MVDGLLWELEGVKPKKSWEDAKGYGDVRQ